MRAVLFHAGLAATAYAALLFSAAAPWWTAALGFAGLLGRLAVGPRRLPDVAVKLLLLVLVVFFVWRALVMEAQADLVELILVLLAPLLLLHVFAARVLFDDFFIVLMSLLILVLAVSAMDGLGPLILTAAYVAIACHGFPAVVRARREALRTGSVRLRGGVRGREARAWAATLLAAGGLVLGFALYLVVPRLSDDPGVADPEIAAALAEARRGRVGASGPTVVTGFPAEVHIGDVGRIKQNDGVAFIASLGREGLAFDPEAADQSLLLLRARAWERYVPASRRWVPGPRAWRSLPSSGRIEPGEAPLEWSMSLRGYDGRTLFLPQRARVVRTAAGVLRLDDDGLVTSVDPIRQYSVSSAMPPTRPEHLRPLVADRRRDGLLAVPEELRPVLPVLARPNAAIEYGVLRVRRFFAEEGFRYTLSLPEIPPGRDPVAAFLERREGHCELFASAACLLLRRMGIPARLAGGVRLSERTAPGVYHARYRNAHAWVEIACRDAGFVAVDFTPPDEQAAGAATRPPAEAAARGADVESGAPGTPGILDWRDPFRYGRNEQRRLVRWVGRAVAALPWLLTLAAVTVILLALLPLAGYRRRRAPLHVSAPPGVPRRALAFYARWLRDCAARGHRRRASQTPREFLSGLPEELRGPGGPITEAFEKRRYG